MVTRFLSAAGSPYEEETEEDEDDEEYSQLVDDDAGPAAVAEANGELQRLREVDLVDALNQKNISRAKGAPYSCFLEASRVVHPLLAATAGDELSWQDGTARGEAGECTVDGSLSPEGMGTLAFLLCLLHKACPFLWGGAWHLLDIGCGSGKVNQTHHDSLGSRPRVADNVLVISPISLTLIDLFCWLGVLQAMCSLRALLFGALGQTRPIYGVELDQERATRASTLPLVVV